MGFHNTALIGASGQGGGYNLESSLRFRSSASTNLTYTNKTATDRTAWTYSVWVKRSRTGVYDTLFAFRTAGTVYSELWFTSNDNLRFSEYNSAIIGELTSSAVYRDTSAWYHIVFVWDSANATSTDRCRLYVNGERITSFSATGYPAQNTLTLSSTPNYNFDIGIENYSPQFPFDGYMTEIHSVDGQALTADDFGEYDDTTGVWKPKEYEGTYGTNGFYLENCRGTDQSGNGNNFTENNFNTTSSSVNYDIMNDVPTLTDEDTANFATLNPLSETSNLSTSEANLAVANSTTESTHRLIRATMGMSTGKYYWEAHVNNSANVDMVGISPVSYNGTDATVVNASGGFGYGYSTSNGNWYAGGGWTSDGTTPPAFPSSGIIGVAFDADNGKLYFHRNGTWINSANPSAGTGANATYTGSETEFLPAVSIYYNTGTWRVNFGQRPFAYTPPTGFKKLNTYNLPDSTIKDGSQYFNPVLYTGNGTSQSITGVGFSPDLVWVKSRNTASYWHNLVDTVRGNTKYLFSNDTTSETTQTTYLTSFDSDGFSIGSNANWNNNGTTYVAWNWRASDSSPVTNTDGTITSTVSANTDSGFSVVSYTGNSTNGATIGHGLGVAPKIVIVKNRDGGWQWIVDISNITGTTSDHLLLNSTAAKNSSNTYFSAKPTSTVFSVNGASYSDTGTSPYKYIAYCFADVEGFSKFGSYTGNGSADGPFIYTGFDVKFLLYKNVDAAISWVIYDNVRDPNGNPQSYYLLPNSSGAEGTTPDAVDFLSNGFKIRYPNASINVTGQNHIYMAFAENPFKNSLAR